MLWDADQGVVLWRGFICVASYLSIKLHQATLISSADLKLYIFFKKDIDSFSGSTSGLFPKEVGTVSFISLELYTLHNYKADKYGFNTKRLQEYTEKR